MNTNPSNIIKSIIQSDQDNYRLLELKALEGLSKEAQADILGLCSIRKDRAKQALGVLLWALISKGLPVAIVSTDNLNELIVKANEILPNGKFDVRSPRKVSSQKSTTVWQQLTSIMLNLKLVEILKPQKGKIPAVIELVHPELLNHFETKATDELRLEVINSTLKSKFDSFEAFKTSSQQDLNTTSPQYSEAARPQDTNTSIPQGFKSSRHSVQ